jgi:uncharacterized protein (TIGR01244 family)
MRTRITLMLAVAASAATGTAGAQSVSPTPAPPAPVILDTAGLFLAKFARVGADMYIAGQPTERALRELKAQGVTVVVNLRMPEEMRTSVRFNEDSLVRALGMRYVHLPVRGTAEAPYTPETLAKFTEAVDGAKGKVLLHCTIAWRASHLWAAYLIKEKGVGEAAALTNARAINLMDDRRMPDSGRHPVEDFLGRTLPSLKRGG